jgi:DNA-binding transcriptional LysR family regulator
MELRHLEYFVAVAEEGNFTQTALRLHIAQSGLSASIQALERELGATLFTRTTRRVVLTEVGRALLVEARRTLAAARGAREAVDSVQGLRRGAVTIGLHPHRDTGVDLPAILARFHAEHPDVQVRVHRAVSASLLADLRLGALDVAFAALLGAPPEGISTIPLRTEPLGLTCAPGHALAWRQGVCVAELGNEYFISVTDIGERPVRTTVDRLFAEAGVERHIICEVNDVNLQLDFVAGGLGVAVVPEQDAINDKRIRFVPLQDPNATLGVVAAISEDPPPSAAARALITLVAASPAV